MNAAKALAGAVARLAQAGVDDPARDAARLLAHALGRPVHFPAEISLSPAQADTFAQAITARAKRQPVAQIIGSRAFWKHDFRVTPDTLDPRPDTETLVEAALSKRWNSVLDLGTGTGAIVISLLADRPGARGLGVDLSAAALAVAQDNAARIGVAVDFTVSDWFSAVTGRFDLIVSNPPYIALAEMADLAAEVRDHEPHLALTDGGDGLNAYRAICARAAAHLTHGGWLMVEIGPTQGGPVAALFAAAGFTEISVLPDLDARDRVVCGRNHAGNA